MARANSAHRLQGAPTRKQVNMVENKARDPWGEFLSPEVLRPCLMSAAIYIAGYEALKDAIVDRIRNFFLIGSGPAEQRFYLEYKAFVLSRNRSPLYASLDWLKNEMGAIDDADICAFDRIKACRNLLAHQLLSFLGGNGLPQDFEQCYREMVALLHKIDHWWIANVEIPTNPDFDGKDIDWDEIYSGRVMALQLLCDIALGDSEQSRRYYDELKNRRAK